MKGYFAFDWTFADGVPTRNFHFLFKPPGKLNEANLADAIETGLQSVNPPDVVAIICEATDAGLIVSAFGDRLLTQAANRASTKVCICVCSFKRDGAVRLHRQLRNPVDKLDDILQSQSKAIRKAGLEKLFDARRVFVVAPPGFTFVKPSQKRSTHFLRAEEALTEVESAQFLAFALLEKLNKRALAVGAKLDVIFVDTMAIASVAYALREIYCALYDLPRPRVVSFHSHDGLDEVDAPLYGTSFTMISASSSMNLEQEWKKRTRCHPDEVVTLLTLDCARHHGDALYALETPDGIEDDQQQRYGQLKDLSIVGERFAPEDLLPKSVLLKKAKHRVEAVARFCEAFAKTGRLAVQSRGSVPTAKVRPVYLDGCALLENGEFAKFTDNVLCQKTPASVKTIVYQSDAASHEIAKRCAKRLQEVMNRAEPLRVVSDVEIEAQTSMPDPIGAMLIVAAVVGRGTKLLSISRDLRDIHRGARTYLIGAQIAETATQVNALTPNLKHSASQATINVERFMGIAIGPGISESFLNEADIFKNVQQEFGASFQDRIGNLRGSECGLAGCAFIASDDELTERLKLRADFAYWTPFYKEDDETSAGVLATVGALLQNAREGKFDDEANRLSTDAFQQVILHPENFTRYNDGAIQAALLRCARVGELDYSRERNSSQFMLDFLSNVFEQYGRRQGEAAGEFALALHTGRLRLDARHFRELQERIEPKLAGDAPRLKLLRVLLGLEEMPRNASMPDEF
ncbi:MULTISPECIES: hypothetical protein [Burkholderia]|uniref:Uncharacterized protein n=1 Tax=Burkholderia contaminans TaxID=488447 RepID=A0A2S5DZN8_9BURK|nr:MULTISPECIES: hypothetical protein [Burkholderia]EKS9796301.1 hypothetical protein [Burkholderia cepacia]EKS9802935.1 hypothetical protein [Burkholderia cepacia]EKS9810419.1 hypothetical protein [Burkholderia cepacia]EKS9817584.1 hypothetical protein [Burkholderia cepacia]EKS9824517.1 hypothetical protein [Burkholderia cepacia]